MCFFKGAIGRGRKVRATPIVRVYTVVSRRRLIQFQRIVIRLTRSARKPYRLPAYGPVAFLSRLENNNVYSRVRDIIMYRLIDHEFHCGVPPTVV